jgi:hypothetical protein
MSLPLTRRIARAALLIAAGAAPVVGAAGSASALALPQAPLGGGLTALDAEALGSTVEGASQTTTELAGETGGNAVKHTVPAAGKAVGKAGKAATTQTASKVVGETAGNATESLGGGTLPTDALGAKGLPTESLPLGDLPLG